MKIIHMNGFTDAERKEFHDIIHTNVILSIRTLVIAAQHFGYEINEENKENAALFQSNAILGDLELSVERGQQIKSLWADEAIKNAYNRSSEFQLTDSTSYFLDKVEQLTGNNYIPTQDDVLRARAKTTGINEIEFHVKGALFRLVDVGGQRSERKKWIHCFQDVTAVLFCTALSEYDQMLYEDATVNRMHESLKLFEEFCNSRWFANITIILFLNKSDLFQTKIAKTDLKCCFPKYTGGNNYEEGIKFIKETFLSTNQSASAKLTFTHVTCATNTDNIKVVFEATRETIMKRSMDAVGI